MTIVEITLMTLNIGLKRRKDENKGKSKEAKKQATKKIKEKAYEILFEEINPVLVFLQESKKLDKIPSRYEYLYKGEASLLYDKRKLKLKMVKSSTVFAIKEKVCKSDQTIEIDEARICVAIAKSRRLPKVKFLCVSWHAPYKQRKKNREKALEDMLSFVDALRTELGLQCVIGGDFNLSFDEVVSCLKKARLDYKAEKYDTLPRRKKLIDLFLTSRSLEVTDVTAVAWDSLENIEVNLDDYFDHDAIVGSLLVNSKYSYEDEDSHDSSEDDSEDDGWDKLQIIG